MSDFRERLKVDLSNIESGQADEIRVKHMYEEFVGSKKEEFLIFINYLNKYINELRAKGIISQFLEIHARIKSTKSALKNCKQKAVDDVFGIEFICATEKEIEVLQHKIEKMLVVYREKVHNKNNGYKAIHHLCNFNMEFINKIKNIISTNINKPIDDNTDLLTIEIQYKTVQVFYEANFGTAKHEEYKRVSISQLQELYDLNKLKLGEDVPYMWISNLHGDDMRQLSLEEILKKMYPSLILDEEKKNKVVVK